MTVRGSAPVLLGALGLLLVTQTATAVVLTVQRDDDRAAEQRLRDRVEELCGDVLEPGGRTSRSIRLLTNDVPIRTVTAQRRDGRTAVVHTVVDDVRLFGEEVYDLDCEGPADAPPDDECVPLPTTTCPVLREGR